MGIDQLNIIGLSENPDLLSYGIDYIWKCCGSESNFEFYKDAIGNAAKTAASVPEFYIATLAGEIVGCVALITNDLNSRQDLFPWLACLYVDEKYRNRNIAGQLMDRVLTDAAKGGIFKVYLSTDLENFYEKKGWKKMESVIIWKVFHLLFMKSRQEFRSNFLSAFCIL
ncbi:MAG: GNAT family N-acetyltransferase [Bacteroidetes bacterium]|nr:GNAT family N-acetyltransferase [Bacteroidota bacterium]